jgi:acetyl esterase/lipase
VEVLSPKGTKMPFRIPSIVGISTLAGRVLSDSRKKDEEWIKNNIGDAERDALERFVRHPLVSPVFGDFRGLPPILIQVGDCELLRDETIALAFKYKSQNLNSPDSWVRHELYHDMIHDFQVASAFLPAAKLSVMQIGRFIDELFNEEKSGHSLILSESEKDLIKLIDSHSEHFAT